MTDGINILKMRMKLRRLREQGAEAQEIEKLESEIEFNSKMNKLEQAATREFNPDTLTPDSYQTGEVMILAKIFMRDRFSQALVLCLRNGRKLDGTEPAFRIIVESVNSNLMEKVYMPELSEVPMYELMPDIAETRKCIDDAGLMTLEITQILDYLEFIND